jgi:anti-sigma B factor antagonist
MQVTSTGYKHCDLIKVEGRIDSATAPELSDALNGIMENNHFKIVIDFSGVNFISSAGLRVLINTQKNCKRYNRGEVVLTNLSKNVYSSLDLAGFTELFKIFDDTVTAVGNF